MYVIKWKLCRNGIDAVPVCRRKLWHPCQRINPGAESDHPSRDESQSIPISVSSGVIMHLIDTIVNTLNGANCFFGFERWQLHIFSV